MFIFYHESSKTFHLQNKMVSYVCSVLPDGEMGQLYYGPRIHDREDFSYLLETAIRSHSAYFEDGNCGISPEHIKHEYPSYGTGDFRQGALEVLQENGSRISRFRYQSHRIFPGKPELAGLPATYTECDAEAMTLVITLADPVTELQLELLYTIFERDGIIARSARIVNGSPRPVTLTRAMSLCLDLPDDSYDWIQLSGSWARERYPVKRPLTVGTTGIESLRGHSSHQENPFVILKRPNTDENAGEAIGFVLVYSGNFQISAQVDPYHVTRILMGIHPAHFAWQLQPGEEFQTPEALIVYSDKGLNAMSQSLHRLMRERLVRGIWRDKERPILINNWEATYFDFNEEKLLKIAGKAKECGVELFVLDDGWFGGRRTDTAGLGDWVPAEELLPDGIRGLSEKIENLGMKFGLWIEPEMVNPDSDLYRAHPDWALQVPGRPSSLSRNQLVLDFSRKEVVDHIHDMIAKILRESKVSYIKWDMNRSLTECYSLGAEPARQGEIFHRHILGVYSLYERLIQEFPEILFESCAGGGGRFDAGMLYYAPQAWTSDDTDAIERVKIQYGTSYAYPTVSMGSHVSAVPNHQVQRITPLKTRADVAYFGTFGYELDLNKLSEDEQEEVKQYTAFMKEHRRLIQFGTFFRLRSPFTYNEGAWMVVSETADEAIVGFYRALNTVNEHFDRLRLQGLDPEKLYQVNGRKCFYGDELMRIGLIISDSTTGKVGEDVAASTDFSSRLFLLRSVSNEEA